MQAKIEWSGKYEVGVKEIDQDHEMLYGLFNDFAQKANSNVSYEELTDFYCYMLKQVALHFEREEEFMRSTGYPDYKKHKAVHATLLRDAREVAMDSELSDEQPDLIPYIDCLRVLIIDHIKDEDGDLADHLKK